MLQWWRCQLIKQLLALTKNRQIKSQSGRRQKTEGKTIYLASVPYDPNSSELLPSHPLSCLVQIIRTPRAGCRALDAQQILVTTKMKTMRDLQVPACQIDNFLPGRTDDSCQIDNDGPPHRVNRALIRLDQVSRLPRLQSFRMTTSLDPVEALHQTLENSHVADLRICVIKRSRRS